MTIRPETDADIDAIRRLTAAAFGRPDEASLVDALRAEGDAAISLVIDEGDGIEAHVLLSVMRSPAGMLGLAPVSVRPDRQNLGLGGALIREALAEAARGGFRAVFVLGEPAYYTRFGFAAERARGFTTPYAGPYLMALELTPGALRGEGDLAYARAFDDLG